MSSNTNAIFISCLILSELCLSSRAEFFTAISDLEPLLETHKRIIDDLHYYIEKEETRLKVLKKQLDRYEVEHIKAMEDVPNYLGNPINAFTLIKRLTTDLDFIEHNIRKGTEYIKNVTMTHEGVRYPTLEDFVGAAEALTRLQETYNLEVSEIADGKLNGVIYSKPMSSSDCYGLGRAVYDEKDYTNALSWLMEAHRKYKEENEPYPFSESDILEYISFCYNMLGNTRKAMRWANKLLAVDPEHPRVRDHISNYQRIIAENEKLNGITHEEKEEEIEVKTVKQRMPPNNDRETYEALCRGEMDVAPEVAVRLKCRYLTENHPFLKLAPIKMEYVYLKPDIVVFHEVLSNEEIEHIQELSKPRFRRATVHDSTTGEHIPARYRISKSAWLRDEESAVVARVSRRVADFTGLDLHSVEDLQVVNYGIGGYYEAHYDFALKSEHGFGNVTGNRIATVLFYMSEVAQGGATVFTKLGLSVFPVHRSAAFWLNLYPSGEGDLSTRHAACPVLRGSKWVCNKWFRQRGQEFVRPCNLEYQAEGIFYPIPKPVMKSYL